MSGARFVRLYPSDWRSGCVGLSLEQEGFYIRICAYIFETGRRLSLNDSQAAKFMGLHTNAYKKVRDQLSAIGKLTRHGDGWTVARAERELAAATNPKRTSEGQIDQDAGRETRTDTLIDTPQDTPIETPIDTGVVFSENVIEINAPLKSLNLVASSHKKPPKSPKGDFSKMDALKAFEAYNETALRCGIPQAAKLTPDRERKIIARLKDYGVDGWGTALAHIERSSFLTGKNDRGFTANLDFVLQPTTFGKLHDGFYGNGRHASPSSSAAIKISPPKSNWTDDDDDALNARLAKEMGYA